MSTALTTDDLIQRLGVAQAALFNCQERLRRLTLFAQQNTNLVDIDDLCEHGAESGCCLSCSAAGPK